MPDYPTSRCGNDKRPGCGRLIIWTVNQASGKRMPVDPNPTIGGNVVLTAGNDAPHATVLTRDEAERRAAQRIRAYVSHFATCPKAHDFRSRRPVR